MKRYALAILPLLLLSSCDLDDKLNLSVASPNGAPAISLYEYLSDKNCEISNAQTVSSYMQSGSKDIIILPTNAGVKMIQNNNAPYKIAATVTFGNFFLASTGNDDNETLDKDDYVVVFQQNSIPDQLFKCVYGTDFSNVHYVADANAAARVLISGKNESDSNTNADYVLVAQPSLSSALGQNSKAKLHSNVQELYKEKTGGKEIMQASIFVNNSVSKAKAKDFLEEIEDDIEDLIEDPSSLDEALLESKLDNEVIASKIGDPATIKYLLSNGNQIGIGYKNAYLNKSSIDAFLNTLGQNITTDEIYFR